MQHGNTSTGRSLARACGILAASMPSNAAPAAEVIATFGRFILVRDATGAEHLARPRGRRLEIVCGDRVHGHWQEDGSWLITAVAPRRTVLRRSNLRGGSETLAANLSLLVVVAAPVPAPDLFLVDRYLCAAASAGITACVALNKRDLPLAPEAAAALECYVRIGYEVLYLDTLSDDGAAPLQAALAGHTAMLAGQSGVGKSSLVRRLGTEVEEVVVGGLMREEEGRHTTTTARLYDCRHGGRIMDSPGVRDYAPAIDDLEPATLGFVDVAALAPQCRFLDCRHMQEPRCAVREALAVERFDARRYESYRRLRRLYEQLWARRHPAGRPS